VESSSAARRLIAASRALARDVDRLGFRAPVRYVYNPLVYARAPHEMYLSRYANGPRRVVFLGMNPGPWGMAQTGVPFGEITAVREWLGICAPVKAPAGTHPRVPVRGFECARSEVSGSRLWGYMRAHFVTAEAMSSVAFVSNYCPLMFLDESGKNVTPDHISASDRPALFSLCDRYLSVVIETLKPEWLIGVGVFARKRLLEVQEKSGMGTARVISLLHPSPANPRSHDDWAGQVAAALDRDGVWKAPAVRHRAPRERGST
jgi:single-strand selective monofunctional uracil DNA glycosylase